MKFEKLANFIQLADCLDFNQAAQSLKLPPAVLKARMASLENEVGASLFSKHKRQLELTPAGQRLLKDAIDLQQGYLKAQKRMHQRQNLSHKEFSLAFVGNGMPPRIGRILQQMVEQFPTIDLKIYDDSNYDSLTSVSKGEVDIYFSYLADERQLPSSLESQALFTVPLCALLPRSHYLAHETTLTLQQLEGETFFLYPPLVDKSLYWAERQILIRTGLTCKWQDSYSKTFYQIAVGSGLGVSLCPWVLKDHIPHSVIAIPLLDKLDLTLYMLYDKQNPSLLLKTFLTFMKTMTF